MGWAQPSTPQQQATNGLKQLAEMESLFTMPINPFRKGKHLQATTMEDYLKTLNIFFGVVHLVEGKPMHQLSL